LPRMCGREMRQASNFLCWVCRTSENVKTHIWQLHPSNSPIFNVKKDISPNFCNYFILANIFLWLIHWAAASVNSLPGKEGGGQVLSGPAPFSQSLLRTPWPGKTQGKIQQKVSLGNSCQWKKYTQLLLIQLIWQSPKFK